MLIHSLEEMQKVVWDMFNALAEKHSGNGAFVIGLSGELGAGKTAFMKALGKKLGIIEIIKSPTFILMQKFVINYTGVTFKNLVHIDAYRMKNEKDMNALGWDELMENPDNLIFIEWPERVKDALPKNTPIIHFEFVDEGTRKIALKH